MNKSDSGLKDKVIGKVKEVEGKITGDISREVQRQAQQAKGRVKPKAKKLKDDLGKDHQIDEDC